MFFYTKYIIKSTLCQLCFQQQKSVNSLYIKDLTLFKLEVAIGFEPMNQGFADPRLTTWLCHHINFFDKNRTQETGRILCPVFYGADDEARTRYLHLGKVALYQMSYIRIQLVPPIGIEPMTRGFSVLCSTN